VSRFSLSYFSHSTADRLESTSILDTPTPTFHHPPIIAGRHLANPPSTSQTRRNSPPRTTQSQMGPTADVLNETDMEGTHRRIELRECARKSPPTDRTTKRLRKRNAKSACRAPPPLIGETVTPPPHMCATAGYSSPGIPEAHSTAGWMCSHVQRQGGNPASDECRGRTTQRQTASESTGS
jgi:hypothetical protein